MKHFPHFLFFAVTLVALTIISCNKDEEDTPSNPTPQTHELLDNYVLGIDGVSITSDEVFTLQEVVNKVLNSGMFSDIGPIAETISALIHSQMADTLDAWNSRYGFQASDIKIRSIKYLYHTIDHQGNPIVLSSYVTWPYPNISNPKEKAYLNRIILFCPFSQTKENFCATATYGGAANALITKDALIITPDPQGFGNNSGHDQMYMNHELIGIQAADAMAAGYKIFLEAGFKLDNRFYLTPMGMSQGAATSVATQRYLESTPLTLSSQTRTLAEWWQFGYSYAACGPYSPDVTMREYLEWDTCSHPAVIPLVLKTMIQSYPQIFGSITEEQFYSQNYLNHKSFFDSAYCYKPYAIEQLNKLLFKKVSTPEHQVSRPNTMVLVDMFNTELLTSGASMNQKLHQCLQRNDLTVGWSPKHNIYITASDCDDYVPYANAQELQRLSTSKVHLLAVDHGTHDMSCILWLLYAFYGTYDELLIR